MEIDDGKKMEELSKVRKQLRIEVVATYRDWINYIGKRGAYKDQLLFRAHANAAMDELELLKKEKEFEEFTTRKKTLMVSMEKFAKDIDENGLNLIGLDGNAFYLMGSFQRAARQNNWSRGLINMVLRFAKIDNYNHLLATLVLFR